MKKLFSRIFKWLGETWYNLRVQRFTVTRVREAYLQNDSRYLQKAYRYGRPYLKRIAAQYLGEIITRDNFEFLYRELKITKNIQLKSYLFLAIDTMLSFGKITVDATRLDYLYQNRHLLKNIGVINGPPLKPVAKPISFVTKDYLGMLEQMKADMLYY